MLGSVLTSSTQKIITGKGSFQTGEDMTPMATRFINAFTDGAIAVTTDDEEKRKEKFIKACINFGQGVGMNFGLPVQAVREIGKITGIGDFDAKFDLELNKVYGIIPEFTKEDK